jgi:gliding motility-associated-like protein
LNYEYEITCTTYTDSRSVSAHRNEIELFFGYGPPDNEASETVPCMVGECQVLVASYTWRNIYRTRHKFPGPGTCYTINFTDPNRVSSVININDSFSVNIPFYIETQLCIYDDLGITSNNSPSLLEMPISYACQNRRYEHNPNAYDPDGDSVSYSLVVPKMGKNRSVTNYTSPEKVPGNEGSSFSLDPATGELVWENPMRPGLYNIAFKVTEWRRVIGAGGTSFMRQIGYVVRDMQIIVVKCDNRPPVISPIAEVCAIAGDNTLITIKVEAIDPDPKSTIYLKASGGPFELNSNRATFNAPFSGNPINGEFKWRIDCEHIRKQPYSVVFNATDNGNGITGNELTDLEQVNITILGPAPRNLQTEAIGNGIELKWDPPLCGGTINYFIYRKTNESNWSPDSCEAGVPGTAGYKLVYIARADETEYYDNRNGNGLFHGVSYCYRITAIYKPAGQFEQSEGVASEESCTELNRDVPMITKASVTTTSVDDLSGLVEVNWMRPTELDTLQYAPPYRFVFKESPDLDGKSFTTIDTKNYGSLREMKGDTVYLLSPRETRKQPHSYQIDFYHFNQASQEEELIGSAKSASTPWLRAVPAYQALELLVDVDAPWKNDSFIFFKKNRNTGNWEYLATALTNVYIDNNLINGVEYCYYAETYGSYRDSAISPLLVNKSQERCAIPRDTIPPCAPELEASPNCDLFENNLTWSFPDLTCAIDVVKYYIFFQDRGIGIYSLIDSVHGGPSLNSMIDNRPVLTKSLAGCYRIVAIDSFGNWSDSSNVVCVDNCPRYELPNIFSPNGDSFNEKLLPMEGFRFVERVELRVYNRWGQQVFETTDVLINWDGTYQKNGKPLNTGVYFVVGEVEYIRLRQNETVKVTGSIHIIR